MEHTSKKKNALPIAIMASAILITGGIATASFAASGEDGSGNSKFKESFRAIKDALDTNDYDTWSSLVNGQIDERSTEAKEKVTEDTFNTLQEIKQLKEDGKFEEAKELMQELGPMPGMPGKGHMGKMQGMKGEHRAEMMQVFEDGDYEAWAALMQERMNNRMGEEDISEDTFNKLKEAHDLRQSGDYDAARDIMEELGFGPKF
ncbi:MAG: hypothetical protein ABIG66_01275 [Candidatus Kerfeldbacteria bacterium]